MSRPAWLVEAEAFASTIVARFGATACGGDVANLARCTDAVERECRERRDIGCPRSIMTLDAQRAQLAVGDPLAWLVAAGVPREAAVRARQLAAKPTTAAHVVRAQVTAPRRPIMLVRARDVRALDVVGALALVETGGGRYVEAYRLEGIKFDNDALDDLQDVHTLAVHDLGGEFIDGSTPAESRMVAVLERLLLARAQNGRLTVITTALASFRERYGDPFVNLLRDYADTVRLDGAA